jgi:hypothetical protein
MRQGWTASLHHDTQGGGLGLAFRWTGSFLEAWWDPEEECWAMQF